MFALLLCCVLCRGRILDDLLLLVFAWSDVPVRDSSVIAANLHACVFVQYMCVFWWCSMQTHTHTSRRRLRCSVPGPPKLGITIIESKKKKKRQEKEEISLFGNGRAPPWICAALDHLHDAGPRLNQGFETQIGPLCFWEMELMMAAIFCKYLTYLNLSVFISSKIQKMCSCLHL